MSYQKAIKKTLKEKKQGVDWNKNAMEYQKKHDGLFMKTSTTSNDMVNHPPHYNQYGIECIDAIKACTLDGFEAYLQGNILKYLWRYKYKNGSEDLKKAEWYLKKLISTVERSSNDEDSS